MVLARLGTQTAIAGFTAAFTLKFLPTVDLPFVGGPGAGVGKVIVGALVIIFAPGKGMGKAILVGAGAGMLIDGIFDLAGL